MTEAWEFDGARGGSIALSVDDGTGEPEVLMRIYMPPHAEVGDADAAFEFRHYTPAWVSAAHGDEPTPLWVVRGQLRRRETEWVIVGLNISQEWPIDVDPGATFAGVTTRVLRETRLGLVHSAMAALANQLPDDPRFFFSDMLEIADADTRAALTQIGPIERPRKGRPRRSPAQYRNFAEVFIRCGGSYRETSQRLDWPEETVRTWLKAARREGWLAPGHPGRRGAPRPGPKLLAYRRSGS